VTVFTLCPLHELPADFGPLRDLSVREGFGMLPRLELQWAEGKRFQRPGEILLGGFLDGQLVAIGGLTQTRNPGALRVRRVYVHPHHRRQGLGRKLMQALIHHAASLPVHELELLTDTESGAHFYESLGFVPVTETGTTHRRFFS
jgi:GNAT superfamily N-acetyltransferase